MLNHIYVNYWGTVSFADTIKETAREDIKQLKDLGIEVFMLTGDNERTAKAIEKKVGIDQVIAEVLPEEKAAKVKAIQEKGKKVAMNGYGVNNVPELISEDIERDISTYT